ncbi:MAG: hypothetical protein K2H89_05850 [Oscillospiraceae bacterium]|nr:hypothetical protein [Oscillospiraceae bacterium]
MNEFKRYAFGQPSRDIYSVEEAIKISPLFLRMLEKTMEIIQKTPDPETFFHRYGYALFLTTELAKMEQVISFADKLPSERKQELFDNKQEYLRNLISRMCEKTDKRMAKLKTGNTVTANINRLQADLKIYHPEMSSDTITYMHTRIETLHQKYQEKFKNLT